MAGGLQNRHISSRLESDFEPFVDMSDVENKHSVAEVSKMRKSRALAAMVLSAEAGLDVEEACNAITDETGDVGLDAVGQSVDGTTLFLIQSKTSEGTPSPTEVLKFNQGIERFLEMDWENLGPKVRARSSEFDDLLENSDLRVQAIFAHLGSQEANADAENNRQEVLNRVNAYGDLLDYKFLGRRDIYAIRNIASERNQVDCDLRFDSWTTLFDSRSEVLGVVNGKEIAQLVKQFGGTLFDQNIRKVLSSSKTNEEMVGTAVQTPQNFWYFNNGITFISSSIKCDKLKPGPRNQVFHLENASVVNGAQTCGSLAAAMEESPEAVDDIYVTVRVIALSDREEGFEGNVTRYTNTQNIVGGREFVALDPWQQEIQDSLKPEGIYYAFRSGDSEGDNYDESFTLEDATRALSCMESVGLSSLAKGEIGRLWKDINATPYTSVFNSEKYDPAVIWNCVRTWRQCGNYIGILVAESYDVRTRKILTNSRYLLCALTLRKMKAEHFDFSDIECDPEDWIEGSDNAVSNLALSIVECFEDLEGNPYPAPFFKNRTRVEEISRSVWRSAGYSSKP